MRIILLLILFSILFLEKCSISNQNITKKTNLDSLTLDISRGDVRMMFYNCENLYDPFDDSLTKDGEFLPDGNKRWTYQKMQIKLRQICKVITAVGGWQPPEVIGLCELENRFVLEQLTRKTPLSKFGYQIIHKESPDQRGIDVGLLYLPEKFYPLHYQAITIRFPFDTTRRTRDILYVKGHFFHKNDTVHIFVNHWPSRMGGQLESEEGRIFVAKKVRNIVDSILAKEADAKIILMGDLNDYPVNKSVTDFLKAKTKFDSISNNELYNLSYYLQEIKGIGSYKYNGEWGILDQMIVSGGFFTAKNSLHLSVENANIFRADFLLMNDENFVGMRPFRTYNGFKYLGGFSDHLPVYVDLFRKK